MKPTIIFPIGTLVIVLALFCLSMIYHPKYFFDWTDIRNEVRDSVKLAVDYGALTGKAVGPSGNTPQQWYRVKWLLNNADKEELYQLKEYPSSVIRTIAFEGLAKRESIDKFKLLKEALNDTTTIVYYEAGCFVLPMMIGEYLMERVIPISDRIPPPPPSKTVEFDLSIQEIDTLRMMYHLLLNRKEELLKK